MTDGFGRRVSGTDPATGDNVEMLELAPGLIAHDAFVAALGERTARLATVRHASYVQVRRLDRPSQATLTLVSDFTPGLRLADVLDQAKVQGLAPDIATTIALIRQLLPAVALFSRHNRDFAIGTLAPERVIITPQARVVIAEAVFGSAIEKLQMGQEALWREYRVALPSAAGLPRVSARADVLGIGIIALTMLLGRKLTLGEFPDKLELLVRRAAERKEGTALTPAMVQWLTRALQLDTRASFQAPNEAQMAFEEVLASDRSYVTNANALAEFVHRATMAPVAAAGAEPREAPSAVVAAAQKAAAASAPPTFFARLRALAPDWAFPLVFAIAMLEAALLSWVWVRPPQLLLAGHGELVVQSRPTAAQVKVDGVDRGVTPVLVPLSPGVHVLEVRLGSAEPRVIPLLIKAGVQTAQYIELQDATVVPALPTGPGRPNGKPSQ
jgi:hypothetical protein